MLLGLDVGTSAVKAAVVDAAGNELSHGRAPTPWRPVPTGAELDPDALLRVYGRDIWGWPVGFAVHTFDCVADEPAWRELLIEKAVA